MDFRSYLRTMVERDASDLYMSSGAPMSAKIQARHLERRAYVYVRQSTAKQVFENTESTARQYGLAERALALGWTREFPRSPLSGCRLAHQDRRIASTRPVTFRARTVWRYVQRPFGLSRDGCCGFVYPARTGNWIQSHHRSILSQLCGPMPMRLHPGMWTRLAHRSLYRFALV